MVLRSIWLGVLVLAAGCPTYSEESRRGAEREDEAAREGTEPADGVDEGVVEVDDHDHHDHDHDHDHDHEAAGEGDVDTVMHRQDAGEPDDTGWYPATSTNGGFRVEVPAKFDDYEVAPSDEQMMHVLQASDGGIRYLVQCSVGGDTPEEKLAAIDEQLPMLGDVEQRRRVRHGGHDGVEYRLSGGNTTITIRSLALEEALCQLIVEAQGTDYPARAGARFMESFALADADGAADDSGDDGAATDDD